VSHDDHARTVDALRDMITSIDTIGRFIAGRTADELAGDEAHVEAIRAKFITLGEAAWRIPEALRHQNENIPWTKIRQYRNFMVHVYDRVRVEPMWITATTSLPPLRAQLTDMLHNLKP
jgi:uncharacterized protein with HEPN domain